MHILRVSAVPTSMFTLPPPPSCFPSHRRWFIRRGYFESRPARAPLWQVIRGGDIRCTGWWRGTYNNNNNNNPTAAATAPHATGNPRAAAVAAASSSFSPLHFRRRRRRSVASSAVVRTPCVCGCEWRRLLTRKRRRRRHFGTACARGDGSHSSGEDVQSKSFPHVSDDSRFPRARQSVRRDVKLYNKRAAFCIVTGNGISKKKNSFSFENYLCSKLEFWVFF